jgi:hypothetical protein
MFTPEKSIYDTIITPILSFLTGKYIVGRSRLAKDNIEFAEDIIELRNKKSELQESVLGWEAKYSKIPIFLRATLSSQPIKKYDIKKTKNSVYNRNKVWSGVLFTGIATLLALRMAIRGNKITLNTARVIGASTGAFLISILTEYNTLGNENERLKEWIIQFAQDCNYLEAKNNMYKNACENSWFSTFFYTNPAQNVRIDDEKLATEITARLNENYKTVEV